MNEDRVKVRSGEETFVHMMHTNGNYATLCGLDGDDPDGSVDQETLPLPITHTVPIDCPDCKDIYCLCLEYNRTDFVKTTLT